jgi:hypothetical protein
MKDQLEHAIRCRAHQLWEEEGRPEGRARIHWLRAEAEFRERLCGRSGRPKANPPRDPIDPSRSGAAMRLTCVKLWQGVLRYGSTH